MGDRKLATHGHTSIHRHRDKDEKEGDRNVGNAFGCGNVGGVKSVFLHSLRSFVFFRICNEQAVCLPNGVSLFLFSYATQNPALWHLYGKQLCCGGTNGGHASPADKLK